MGHLILSVDLVVVAIMLAHAAVDLATGRFQ